MGTRTSKSLTTEQLIELAEYARKIWRQHVADGKVKFDPQRMRKYDQTLAELRALHQQRKG